MIRAAKFGDIPRIAELFGEMYERSKYKGRGQVDIKECKALLMRSMQRHGSTSDGGTFVAVSETEGVVHGFILGILDRVYHVGDKLTATDVYWYMGPGGSPREGFRLFDAMVEWAEANPQVIEIKPGATDAIGDYERTEKFLQRRGFTQCGVIYEKEIQR